MVPARPRITDSLIQYDFLDGVVLGDDYGEQIQNMDEIDMIPLSHGPRPQVRQSNVQAMYLPVLNTLCKEETGKASMTLEEWKAGNARKGNGSG